MRSRIGFLVLLALLLSLMAPTSSATSIAGTVCKKEGVTKVLKNKKFTCIRLGKSLYWDNGTTVKKSVPSQSISPTPIQSPLPSQSPSQARPSLFDTYQPPKEVTNVNASWSAETLLIQFEWDPIAKENRFAKQFIVELSTEGVTSKSRLGSFPTNSQTGNQKIELSKEKITEIFGVFRTSLNSVCITVINQWGVASSKICAKDLPRYELNLPIPIISVSPVRFGYSVSYSKPDSNIYDAIEIVEFLSDSSTEPVGVKYSRSYFGKDLPAVVIVSLLKPRWIKARFSSSSGNMTEFSVAQRINPMT